MRTATRRSLAGRIALSLSLLALAYLFGPATAGLEAQETDSSTRLLRQPTVSESLIAFRYAGDLWVVGREGGTARRLTAHRGVESHPHFSPDGETVAFTAQYDGNFDVYVVPIGGGQPRRLTWHPGGDVVEGWTPDGDAVLFTSTRRSVGTRYRRFFTVPETGGLPEPLALPRAQQGAISPDGGRVAYQEVDVYNRWWRKYRGGKARPISLFDREDHTVEKLPREGGSRQIEPVWLDETVYLLSDRTGILNVWAHDTGSGDLQQVTDHRRFGVMSLDPGGGVVAYEQGGRIHLYDPAADRSRPIKIRVAGDFPRARPRWEEVGDQVVHGALSPDGQTALLEARGEIFSVPADGGGWRNLTRSSGAADRRPAWSPDGERAAWFSDGGGEYALVVDEPGDPDGPRRIALENPTFFYDLRWSPDGRYVLFTDADRRLWYLDTETGEQVLVDQDPHHTFYRSMDPVWSPDGRWIAYAKRVDNGYSAIRLYSVERDTAFSVTGGRADAISPAWDPGGEYLYFAASTDYSLHTGGSDMSTFHRPLTRALYAAVLPEGTPPPGRSDGAAEGSGSADPDGGPTVRVDPAGLTSRIVPLDLPTGRYDRLRTGREPGVLFYLERETTYTPLAALPGTLHRYDAAGGEETTILPHVDTYAVAPDAGRLLYQSGDTWGVVPTKGRAETGQGALATDGLRVHLDPRREWRQIFEEAWRIKRDYFYVENMHGTDWEAVREKYLPWMEHVRSRSDLTTLLAYVAGELSVSHAVDGGGDQVHVEGESVGVLGAELEPADSRYRIRQIHEGAPWTPDVRAPLAAPGLDVSEGDYLLAVNGEALAPPDNPYRALAGTGGRKTTLRVNDRPTREGSRQVTVTPLESVHGLHLLRQWSWVERNRSRVDSLSDGRLAYVWVPDTGLEGYRTFNRLYFNQQDRQGVVVDARFNNGGFSPDYMIHVMTRRLLGFDSNPTVPGKSTTEPGSGIWGPKVMVINEEAGSGGDDLAYFFKTRDVGPLVGRRTAGLGVGVNDFPDLVDGGFSWPPRVGSYDLNGEWAIENEGVAPDIRVEQTPRELIRGADPQLDRAVEEALRLLEEKEWPSIPPRPTAPETAAEPPRAEAPEPSGR